MLDINLFRTDLAAVAAGLAKRGVTLDTAAFEALERERKDIQTRTQELQSRRNTLSKEIGIAKGKGQDAAPLLAEVAGLGDALKTLEAELDRVQGALRDFLLGLPNLTHASTPVGRSTPTRCAPMRRTWRDRWPRCSGSATSSPTCSAPRATRTRSPVPCWRIATSSRAASAAARWSGWLMYSLP